MLQRNVKLQVWKDLAVQVHRTGARFSRSILETWRGCPSVSSRIFKPEFYIVDASDETPELELLNNIEDLRHVRVGHHRRRPARADNVLTRVLRAARELRVQQHFKVSCEHCFQPGMNVRIVWVRVYKFQLWRSSLASSSYHWAGARVLAKRDVFDIIVTRKDYL